MIVDFSIKNKMTYKEVEKGIEIVKEAYMYSGLINKKENRLELTNLNKNLN